MDLTAFAGSFSEIGDCVERLTRDHPHHTHSPASLYETFKPEEAKRLTNRFEFHYTSKHGSWLNMAEIELEALIRQCLTGRIADKANLESEVNAWQNDRNGKVV